MLDAPTISTIVVGIGLGLFELARQRREKKVVKTASDVDRKTDEQTALLHTTNSLVLSVSDEVRDLGKRMNIDGEATRNTLAKHGAELKSLSDGQHIQGQEIRSIADRQARLETIVGRRNADKNLSDSMAAAMATPPPDSKED